MIPASRRTYRSRCSKMPLRLSILAAALCCFVNPPVVYAQAGAKSEAARSFDIPSQPLAAALSEFARQSNQELLFTSDITVGKTSQGISGTMSPLEALRRLLGNTEISISTTDNGAILLRDGPNLRESLPPEAILRSGKEGDSGLGAGASSGQEAAGYTDEPREDTSRRSVSEEVRTLADVVVTGTHIRGNQPVGAPVLVITSSDIEKTLHATVKDIVEDLPQNFRSGAASEGTGIGGGPESVNTAYSSSVNLRGLGPGSTLVLLNGRRLSPAGSDASFVDVSSIPASAIDRIEILLDSASAIYGSDAVGGVVNVILKDRFDSAQTIVSTQVPTQGGAQEYRFGQALGGSWQSGSALLTYEYYQRQSLAARDRDESEDQDLRRFGGSDYRINYGNPGTISIGSETWAIPRGQDGTALTPGSFDGLQGTRNLYNVNSTRSVLPLQQRHSLFASLKQNAGDRLELSVDALFSRRDSEGDGPGGTTSFAVPETNAFYVNPTGGTGPVIVDYNFVDDLGPSTVIASIETYSVGVGAVVDLSETWQLNARANRGREEIDQVLTDQPDFAALYLALADPNPETAFNPFGDGSFTNPLTLEMIRDETIYGTKSQTSGASIGASGAIFELPGGNLLLAVGAEHREQEFGTSIQNTGIPLTQSSHERNVNAIYGELRIPIVGNSNQKNLANRLDVSVTARHERYSDFGSATTPALGISWAPSSSVTLRMSRSESFKAPTLPSIDETANLSLITALPDSESPTGVSPILAWLGSGNADLSAERSRSWTAGVAWQPRRLPGTRIELNYYSIDFEDRIQYFAVDAPIFLIDPRYAEFVTRNPTAEQRAVVCSRARYLGTPDDCTETPVAAIIDVRPRNTARSVQEGLDLLASTSTEWESGTLQLSLNTTYILKFNQAATRTSEVFDIRNTPFQPTDFRARGSVTWSSGPWRTGMTIHYTDGYRDTVSGLNRDISSWTTIDLIAAYEKEGFSGSWLDGVLLTVGVQNLFNRAPPFFNNPAGIAYDPTNAEIIGRSIGFQVRKEW